jgi:hypothetical protein
MMEKLGKHIAHTFEKGDAEKFNKEMKMGLRFMGKAARQELEFRMKPYCTEDYFEWIKKARKFNVRDVITDIKCPIFIADPEDEQFWPGQPQQVFQALTCAKTIVQFTAEEGANWHCQPMARALYDQRIFDWLNPIIIDR